jgi:hypothetical protein
MEEAAFSKKKSVFHQHIGLKFQQETSNVPWNRALIGAETWTFQTTHTEITGKFSNAELEKGGKD